VSLPSVRIPVLWELYERLIQTGTAFNPAEELMMCAAVAARVQRATSAGAVSRPNSLNHLLVNLTLTLTLTLICRCDCSGAGGETVGVRCSSLSSSQPPLSNN
jgi:hypothetical protein